MAPRERFFDEPAEMIRVLADETTARLQAAVSARGAAGLIAAGGSTPAPLYQALARRPLSWERVSVVPSDESWLGPGAERTNELLLRETLLQGEGAPARLVWLLTGDRAPEVSE